MKISAVIVTFNPGNKIEETVEELKKQVEKIYIIDNNSKDKSKLKGLEELKKIEIIYNEKNIGLAAAQNIGIKKSIEDEIEWILFLDDDSKIEKDFIFKLKEGYNSFEKKEKLGILSANIKYKNIDKITSYPQKTNFFIKRRNLLENNYLDNIMFVISSGSLINIKVIKQIGLFEEKFFVDHIDVEYCLRLISKGYKIRVVKEAILWQKVGNTEERSVLGIKSYPTNHNPKRQYTKFRNAIWTWKKYVFLEPKYVFYDNLLMFHHAIRVLLFEEHKKENLKNIFFGIKDGIFKKG